MNATARISRLCIRIIGILLLAAAVGCTYTAGTQPATIEPTPAVPFTWNGSKRPLLMAHYMPWFQSKAVSGSWGWHWTMNNRIPSQQQDGSWRNLASHFTPMIGPYDSSDTAVLEYQVSLMKLSGIDGVIVDWYGNEDSVDYGMIHSSTLKLFDAIQKAGLKFAICYEDQSMKHMIENTHFLARQAIPQGQKVMDFLEKTWFGQDAYLNVKGQPVLFTFGPQFYTNSSDWKTLFSQLHAQPLLVTLDNHNVTGMGGSFPWPPMWASQSGTLTQGAAITYLDGFYAKAKSWNVIVGAAFPGFHDYYKEAGVGPSYGFLDANNGETFRATLQNALDHQPEIIQLITWNDYGEGTNIEPTVEYGDQYLEMVQQARRMTSMDSFGFRAKDLDLPLRLYTLRKQYAKDSAVNSRLDQAAAAIAAGDLKSTEKILNSYAGK